METWKWSNSICAELLKNLLKIDLFCDVSVLGKLELSAFVSEVPKVAELGGHIEIVYYRLSK